MITALAAVLLGGLVWYAPWREQKFPASLGEAIVSVYTARSEKAIENAYAYLEEGDGRFDVSARTIIAQETINTSTTTEDIAVAIALWKENFASARTQYAKAVAVKQIARALFMTNAPYRDVFHDDFFKSLRVKDDPRRSLENLIRYSISLHPTAGAYLLLARQEADSILESMQAGSSEPLDDSPAAAARLRESAAKIGEYVDEADLLTGEDILRAESTLYAPLIGPSLAYWRGHALAAAAHVDPSYLAEAERSYNSVYVASAIETEGEELPALERLKAETEFAYARALLRVEGKARAGDIRVHLERFVAFLAAHPERHEIPYANIAFAQSAAQLQTPDTREQLRARRYREYVQLANLSPQFKTFLEAQGWKL